MKILSGRSGERSKFYEGWGKVSENLKFGIRPSFFQKRRGGGKNSPSSSGSPTHLLFKTFILYLKES